MKALEFIPYLNLRMSKKLYNLLSAGIYCIPLLLFIAVAWFDINPSGKRFIQADIEPASALISPLFPAQRLSKIEHGTQVVKNEPIYFTIRYPHKYRELALNIDVKNQKNIEWFVGLETGEGEIRYTMAKPDSEGSVIFSLHNALVTNRTIRILISVPGVSEEDAFAIDRVSAQFLRPHLFEYLQRALHTILP